MSRMRTFEVIATTVAVSVVVGGMTLALGAATAGAVPTPSASCTFNGHPNNSFVPGITPGGSIAITCTGLPIEHRCGHRRGEPFGGPCSLAVTNQTKPT